MDCRHKPRAKRSPIWKLPAEAFRQHHSLASVLRHLGLHVGAGNYRTLRSRIVAEKIDVSHMDPNVDRVRAGARRAIPLQDILVADTPYRGGTNHIKKKLLREGLLENRCTLCGLGDTWNGAPIVHRLDHIDGDSQNFTISNLRMVCPNCDSQLATFAGRNRKRSRS